MRLLSIFLVAGMALTLSACGNKAEAPPTGDEAIVIVSWMKDGSYYFEYTGEMEIEGEKTQSKGMVASNGEAVITRTETTIEGETVTMKVMQKDDMLFMINDASRTVTKYPRSLSSAQDMTNYAKMEFVKRGTEEVKGRKFAYEEYKADGITIRFYKDGKNLYAIENISVDSKMLMVIDNYSQYAPEGTFDLPVGYAETSF